MSDYMSSGAIAGLVIGILCFVTCLVLLTWWLVRFRHYWACQKHTKMSNHTGNEVPCGAANQLYSSDPSDCRVSSESWTNGSFGLPKTNWNSAMSSSSTTTQRHSSKERTDGNHQKASIRNGHRSVNFGHTWVDTIEQPFGVTSVPYSFATPKAVDVTQRSEWFGPERIHVGDCSGADNNAFNLYPSLPYVPGDVEKTDSDLAPYVSGPRKSERGATLRKKLKANVQKMARASQSEVFRFTRPRSTKTSLTRESKRTKRSKRGSRKSLPVFNSGLGVLDDEGYYNMNATSDSYRFDDMGSLDNDNFLCRLEKAVYPGLVVSQSLAFPASCQDQSDFWSKRSHNRMSSSIVGTSFPGPDYRVLASADLSLGSNMPGAYWKPLQPNLLNLSTITHSFRFPAPGPPVAGWAHHLAQSELSTSFKDVSPSPGNATLEPSASSTAALTPGLIPPPFSPADHRSRISENHSSLAVPRRRPGQRAKGRQTSEPRRGTKLNASEANNSGHFSQPDEETRTVYFTRPTSFGSETTLDSILDPTVNQNPIHINSASDNPVDSGYQDTLVDTSLDLSTQCSNSPKQLILPQAEPARSPLLSSMAAFPIPDAYAKVGLHPLEDTVKSGNLLRTELARGRQRGQLLPDLSDKLTGQYFGALADITTSQSSNGTSNESGDSRTIMLSSRSKERSISVSRQLPSEQDHPAQQHYRSPSYPDFYSSQLYPLQSPVQRSGWSTDINNPSRLSSADQENMELRGPES